jgi:hypothetical protein
MRTYPRNSPEAASRILALTLLADGHFDQAEAVSLEQARAFEALGMRPDELDAAVSEFCADLLSCSALNWSDACFVDPATLASLMAEIDDPALRRTLLHLCVKVVEADQQVTEAEAMILRAAVEHWGLHREALELGAPVAH